MVCSEDIPPIIPGANLMPEARPAILPLFFDIGGPDLKQRGEVPSFLSFLSCSKPISQELDDAVGEHRETEPYQ